ncbi:MAG: hypothetical protein QM811_05970 [Pirellulales bacterium]
MKGKKMTVAESIELMKRNGDHLAKPIPVQGMQDMEFECTFDDCGLKESDILETVPNCPPDLLEFWKTSSRAQIFADKTYGQWGLEILDPNSMATLTKQFQNRRKADYMSGDIVVGKFLGDSDLLLIRTESIAL